MAPRRLRALRQVDDARPGHQQDAEPRRGRAPAVVDLLAVHEVEGIESADNVEDRAADPHRRADDGGHRDRLDRRLGLGPEVRTEGASLVRLEALAVLVDEKRPEDPRVRGPVRRVAAGETRPPAGA